MIAKLLSGCIFIALFFTSAWLLPYALTSEHYTSNHQVSSLFPIAVKGTAAPTIIRWGEYEKKRAEFDGKLFVGKDNQRYPTGEFEAFSMKHLGDNTYLLTYTTDDYDFWAVYSVVEGTVKPEKFRYNGPFVVPFALGIAAVGVWLFGRARRRHITNGTVGAQSQ